MWIRAQSLETQPKWLLLYYLKYSRSTSQRAQTNCFLRGRSRLTGQRSCIRTLAGPIIQPIYKILCPLFINMALLSMILTVDHLTGSRFPAKILVLSTFGAREAIAVERIHHLTCGRSATDLPAKPQGKTKLLWRLKGLGGHLQRG